jgi:hypothetical protein
LDTQGLAPPDVEGTLLRVGISNSYSKSFCVKRQLCFYYRSFFRFDLQGVTRKVKSATLSLRIASSQVSKGSDASNTGCCAGSLNTLDSAYSGESTIFHQVSPISMPSDIKLKIDITTIVCDWLAGKVPNYGLMLRSVSESFKENNDVCVTFFEMPSLLLEYESFL